jgi:hypothetical protein
MDHLRAIDRAVALIFCIGSAGVAFLPAMATPHGGEE